MLDISLKSEPIKDIDPIFKRFQLRWVSMRRLSLILLGYDTIIMQKHTSLEIHN